MRDHLGGVCIRVKRIRLTQAVIMLITGDAWIDIFGLLRRAVAVIVNLALLSGQGEPPIGVSI